MFSDDLLIWGSISDVHKSMCTVVFVCAVDTVT